MNSDGTTECNYGRTCIKSLDEGELIKQSSYDVITLTANGFQMKLRRWSGVLADFKT